MLPTSPHANTQGQPGYPVLHSGSEKISYETALRPFSNELDKNLLIKQSIGDIYKNGNQQQIDDVERHLKEFITHPHASDMLRADLDNFLSNCQFKKELQNNYTEDRVGFYKFLINNQAGPGGGMSLGRTPIWKIIPLEAPLPDLKACFGLAKDHELDLDKTNDAGVIYYAAAQFVDTLNNYKTGDDYERYEQKIKYLTLALKNVHPQDSLRIIIQNELNEANKKLDHLRLNGFQPINNKKEAVELANFCNEVIKKENQTPDNKGCAFYQLYLLHKPGGVLSLNSSNTANKQQVFDYLEKAAQAGNRNARKELCELYERHFDENSLVLYSLLPDSLSAAENAYLEKYKEAADYPPITALSHSRQEELKNPRARYKLAVLAAMYSDGGWFHQLDQKAYRGDVDAAYAKHLLRSGGMRFKVEPELNFSDIINHFSEGASYRELSIDSIQNEALKPEGNYKDHNKTNYRTHFENWQLETKPGLSLLKGSNVRRLG